MGSQGQLVLSWDQTQDKTFGVAQYAKFPKCRSILSGASDLDWYICFVLGYPTGGMCVFLEIFLILVMRTPCSYLPIGCLIFIYLFDMNSLT